MAPQQPTETHATASPGEPAAEELQRLRLQLANTEDRFRTFLDSEIETIFCYELPEPVDVAMPAVEVATRFLDARLVACNALYARARGAQRPEELYGKGMRELAREDIGRVQKLIEILLLEGNRHDGMEIKQVQPDGSLRFALAKAHLVVVSGFANRLWVILRDITVQKQLKAERETLELQLRQAQRMESLGLLAGGIAHDFNNLLVVIGNCARLAEEDLQKDPEEAKESLRQIEQAANRAADLTRSLLAFSRTPTGGFKPLIIDQLLLDVTGMLKRLIPGRVQLKTFLCAPLVVTRADRGQVEQMLVNLVINAVDAIADVGFITLETHEVELTKLQRAAYPWARASTFARITVTDTGVGVPEEVRSRIFEPFFTTKTDGKGTGLGLAVVWGAAKQHGGFVEVQSAAAESSSPGVGTRFCVYLPTSEDVVTTSALPSTRRGAANGTETILLVEDHVMVSDVARLVLERAGYKVLLAFDGIEALRLFDQHKQHIHAVILDAIIPLINGYDVHRHIENAAPNLPILVASGHTSDVFPPHFFDARPHRFLPKPYKGEDLLQKLRHALDEALRRA